jgi:GNAT superfamily N-acetyltransferase
MHINFSRARALRIACSRKPYINVAESTPVKPEITNFEAGFEEEIVNAWNKLLRYDPVDLKVFERKVLLDPNFEAEGLKVARGEGGVEGFALCLVRRYPLFYQGLEEEHGWITALAFEPQRPEVGGRLVEEALAFFRARGRRIVWFATYTPNYFFPGVDPDRYGWLLQLLERHGFERVYEALSMDAQLWPDYAPSPEVEELERKLESEGVEVRPLETRDIYPFLKFLERNFPADWYRHALELLQSGCEKGQILVAVKSGEVLGYCQYWHSEDYNWHRPGAHFGPFGVREDARGKGIGTVLLARCLWEMRKERHPQRVRPLDGRAGSEALLALRLQGYAQVLRHEEEAVGWSRWSS